MTASSSVINAGQANEPRLRNSASAGAAATSLRARETSPSTKVLAVAIVALLAAQVALGASIVWTGRNPYVATAHVLVGAVTLAATFLLTWLAHRDMLESVPDTAATVPLPGAAEGKPVPA